MAQSKTIHTKRLSVNRCRDLNVYYEKDGQNYWDYSKKPKGIYFASHSYTHVEGSSWHSWSTGQKGDGYILAVPLERYKPTALKMVCARVKTHADLIHQLIEAKETGHLIALVKGEMSQEALRGLGHAFAPIGPQDQVAA